MKALTLEDGFRRKQTISYVMSHTSNAAEIYFDDMAKIFKLKKFQQYLLKNFRELIFLPQKLWFPTINGTKATCETVAMYVNIPLKLRDMVPPQVLRFIAEDLCLFLDDAVYFKLDDFKNMNEFIALTKRLSANFFDDSYAHSPFGAALSQYCIYDLRIGEKLRKIDKEAGNFFKELKSLTEYKLNWIETDRPCVKATGGRHICYLNKKEAIESLKKGIYSQFEDIWGCTVLKFYDFVEMQG